MNSHGFRPTLPKRFPLTVRDFGGIFVEAAITIPLLLLLVYGIIEWGRIFSAQITLQHASAIAARSAVLSTTPTGVDRETFLSSVAKDAAGATLHREEVMVDVTSVPVGLIAGNVPATKVTVTYTLPLVIPAVVPNSTNGKLLLTASTIMR
jgi:Flp pilus assembly protein TadG